MERKFGSMRLAPAGLLVEHTKIYTDCVFLDVHSAAASARCPCCGTTSRRTQSRYLRQAADLPIAGRRVVLRVAVRRFWCDAVLCRRRIFAERFGVDVLAPLSRRTGRLETIVHHLGLALGGRPAAAFADRLMMPVSNDTLLRVVRRRTEQPCDELAIIGIDDFAWRRGQRYGTIVCDLERRRPVTLLADREQATSQAWLTNHPSIVTVARDRGGGYGEAIAKALPHADQVADRWHLMENASRAFFDAVRKSMRQIRKAVGSTIVDPKLLTYAERLQYERYQRRQQTNETILELSKQGVPIKQIVKRTGHSRKLVRSVLRGQRSDVFRVRQSSLEEWLPWLDRRWDQGARNGSALWREMRKKGFRGQIGVVSEWARRRRLVQRADQGALARTPSARSITRLMTLARDDLSKSDAVLIAAIESNVPDLVTARTLIDDFQQMIRSKAVAKLDAWLDGAKASLVGSFANGVEKDIAAVRNAIASPWSNGQTEGQITKLKLIKRHVWTASALQGDSLVTSRRWVQSCVRPVYAA